MSEGYHWTNAGDSLYYTYAPAAILALSLDLLDKSRPDAVGNSRSRIFPNLVLEDLNVER